MFVLGEKAREVPEKEQVIATLKLAIRLFRPGELAATPYFGVTYYFGETAYEHWAKDLTELDYPADTKKPRPGSPEIYDLSTMIYQVQQIVRGRAAAAVFCEKAAGIMPAAAGHLHVAAKEYRDEVAIAEKAFGPFLSGKEDMWKSWLSDGTKRKSGAEDIIKMLGHERAATAAIEKALSVIEGK